MEIKTFVFNAFYENTFVISTDTNEAIIIDPGCYERHEQDELTGYIRENNLVPVAIVCTHCHIDHVLGCAFLKQHYDIPLCIPEGELEVLRAQEVFAPNWGITGFQGVTPDRLLKIDEAIMLGNEELEIRYAPGHAPGHLMYYHAGQKQLIAGDVIFRESIGRTDLPGGDFDTLEQAIRTQVYDLPDEVTIFPGHGSTTTVGHEKIHNPFVRPA